MKSGLNEIVFRPEVRALLDTNVLISNLLSRNATTSATGLILQAAIDGRFTLLFVAGVADELHNKLIDREDLSRRIDRGDARTLIADLRQASEVVERLPEPYAAIGRDRKDDYLIAYALAARANYLVSWDKDLLDLSAVAGVQMVSPPGFLAVLRETPDGDSATTESA